VGGDQEVASGRACLDQGDQQEDGLHRKTISRALAAAEPPKYSRPTGGSKLDPVKDWICEQLQGIRRIQSQRLREMAGELGYEGGKSIFDDSVREVRPRFLAPRTFQRTIYQSDELRESTSFLAQVS
jgi:hypothetical protein